MKYSVGLFEVRIKVGKDCDGKDCIVVKVHYQGTRIFLDWANRIDEAKEYAQGAIDWYKKNRM